MLMILGGIYKMGGQRGMMEGGMAGNPIVGMIMGFLTWAAVLFVLVAIGRFFWKKGDKVK